MSPFKHLRLRSRTPGLIGAVDPQWGLVAAVVKPHRTRSGKFAVTKCWANPSAELNNESVTELAGRLPSGGLHRVLVLPRGLYQVTQIDKPEVKQEELDQSLRWALTPVVDYPASEANIDWLPIPNEAALPTKAPQIYLISSRKKVVDQQAEFFSAANAELEAVDVRETSQRNISAHLEKKGAGACLVNAENSGIQITVTYKGELFLERFIREAVYVNGQPADEAQINRIALEIQRSIDFIRRVYPFIRIDEVLVAPTLQPIGLANRLLPLMHEPVREIDLGEIFEWPKGSDLNRPQEQARYFYALGAALRFSASEK